jgi:hypothetical protein
MSWVTDNDGTATPNTPYEFISSFNVVDADGHVGDLDIATSNFNKYAIRTTNAVRLTVSLPESTAKNKSIMFAFQLVVKHACADNHVQLTDNLPNQNAYIASGTDPTVDNKLIAPFISTSVAFASCPLTCTLNMWDPNF